MKRLRYYPAFETDKNKEDDYQPPEQNSFGGISTGDISLFATDVEPSRGGSDNIEGCNFTMCSTKICMWSLQTRECNLIGINSPFGRRDYTAYINTLPKEVVDLLQERIEHYGLHEEGAMLFGINNNIRILQARMDDIPYLYYIVYPDGDVEMTSDPNNSFGEDTVNRLIKYQGKKLHDWLNKMFKCFINQEA